MLGGRSESPGNSRQQPLVGLNGKILFIDIWMSRSVYGLMEFHDGCDLLNTITTNLVTQCDVKSGPTQNRAVSDIREMAQVSDKQNTMQNQSMRVRKVAVIGGGITGLAAAHRLVELDPTIQLTLFEASDRLGGVLETIRRDGFLIEGGADNFITTVPWAMDLCRRIGFESQLAQTNSGYFFHFTRVSKARRDRQPGKGSHR